MCPPGTRGEALQKRNKMAHDSPKAGRWSDGGKMERAGILFDLDGVLIESEEAHYEATRQAFLALGLPALPPELSQELMIGRPDREALAAGLAAFAQPLSLLEPLLLVKAARYRELLTSGIVRPLPDGIATLRSAVEAGFPVAVVTGARAEEARWALSAAGVLDQVSALIAAEDVRYGKPHPEPYQRACRALGVSPEASLAIEDSPAGIKASQEAGLRVVAVARRQLPGLEKADMVIPQLEWPIVLSLIQRSTS